MLLKTSKISKKNLLFLYYIYFFIYLYIYLNFITIVYEYTGYRNNFSVLNLPNAILSITISVLLINNNKITSMFFSHALNVYILIPSMVLYCGSDLPLKYYLLTLIPILIIGFIASKSDIKIYYISSISNKKIVSVFFALSIFTILAILAFGGAKYINFNLSQVYDFRSDAASNLPGIFGYINSTVTKVIIPFGIVLSLFLKRWIFTIGLFFCSVLLFGLTAHKGVLFYPVVTLIIYFFASKNNAVYYLIGSFILLGLFSIVEYNYLSDYTFNLVTNFLIRRAIFTSVLLNWFYMDWFSMSDFYYWADSKITFGLIDAPHELKSVNLIGLNYFDDEEMSANTGFIGSAYANAGMFGVFLYAIIIGYLFAFLNSIGNRLGHSLVIALFFIIIRTILTGTDIFTSLLTHGLLASIIISLFIKPIFNRFNMRKIENQSH